MQGIVLLQNLNCKWYILHPQALLCAGPAGATNAQVIALANELGLAAWERTPARSSIVSKTLRQVGAAPAVQAVQQ